MIAVTTSAVADRTATMLKKLRFLRGNLHLIIIWPIAVLILCVVGWGALLAKLNEDRRYTENFALRESAALSASYADHLTRTIEALDQITLHVKYEWILSNGRLQLENVKETGLVPPSSLLNLSIVDRNGVLISSTTPGAKPVSVSDRPYFQMQKNAPHDSLYIGVPMLSRITHRNVIPFARRLADQAGNFSGVVLVTVEPDYLTANYDDTTLGTHGFLGVVGGDRIVRATRIGYKVYPPETPALITLPYFASKHGSVLAEGEEVFRDKRNRYLGWRALEKFALVAMTGLDEEDTLATYRANRAASIRYAIWATIAMIVFTFIAMFLSTRLAWRKYQLSEIQATYRVATEGGKEGFYIVRPIRSKRDEIVDFEIIDCNRRGAEFFHGRREDLIGKKVSTLYEGADFQRPMGRLCQAMKMGVYEDEVEVSSDTPFTTEWVHFKIVRADGDLAVTMRDISSAKAHVKELERRGNEDALTGLPNRHWMQTYLPLAIERAQVNHSMLALLFVDLDGFKAVNDTLGHPAGDELLRNAARRLKDAVRPDDHVIRLGGDEFLIILEDIAHKTDAAHVAERILHAFKESFRLLQGIHSVGTSIGISVFPSDGTDADNLLRHADVAMYSVKTSGKGNYRFYDQNFYDALRTRLEQETELRNAIEHDQFIMYYQPRVDISTGNTCSMEALIRWAHPVKGLIEPLEFIALAEETGLILKLGELVINKVCAQIAYWSQKSHELVPVSINVSARQFNDADIAKTFTAALERHGVDPTLVEIELTESSMMGNGLDVAEALAPIRRMGIKLLVDDFGTGYSSLSQLQRLDFDVLKVDRAFTAEIDKTERGNVFFKAIITMAHALGMRVVAEGVENERQIKILKSLYCDEIQGYYISRPHPPTETQPILPK